MLTGWRIKLNVDDKSPKRTSQTHLLIQTRRSPYVNDDHPEEIYRTKNYISRLQKFQWKESIIQWIKWEHPDNVSSIKNVRPG